MRLTTRTNLAMRALMFCAVNPGQTVRKADVAAACNASENHLGLVINQLSQAGFVQTSRGRHGGMRLGHAPEEISVGAVFRLLESNLPFAECFSPEENTCPLAGVCRLNATLCKALNAFYATLDAVTLADLTRDNTALQAILCHPAAAA
jgi:Rrf2 family nitric oxide-sensitive transcriptional repressor